MNGAPFAAGAFLAFVMFLLMFATMAEDHRKETNMPTTEETNLKTAAKTSNKTTFKSIVAATTSKATAKLAWFHALLVPGFSSEKASARDKLAKLDKNAWGRRGIK